MNSFVFLFVLDVYISLMCWLCSRFVSSLFFVGLVCSVMVLVSMVCVWVVDSGFVMRSLWMRVLVCMVGVGLN